MSRDERERIEDMIELCHSIRRFVGDMDFDAFAANQEKQFAVTHALFLLRVKRPRRSLPRQQPPLPE